MLLRKLLIDCRWPGRDDDFKDQQLQLPRRKSLVLHSISETTLNSGMSKENIMQSSSDINSEEIGASGSQTSVANNKRRAVPVLFSTNCGLYLRVPKKTLSSFNELPSGSDVVNDYNISFCDLERWSTNRAHTISLEDTFTIARSPPQNQNETPPQVELYVPNRRICFDQHCNSNRFQPAKRAVRLYNAFSRFETRY